MFIGLSFLFIACQESNIEKETLEGKEFILQESEGFDKIEGTEISLDFENKVFTFQAGCNTHSGEYTLEEQTFLSQDIGSTLMGCEEALMNQDSWLVSFFTSLPTIDYSESTLILENEDAILIFAIVDSESSEEINDNEDTVSIDVEMEDEDSDEVSGNNIIGKNWIVHGYFNNGEEQTFNEEIEVTFLFGENGMLNFFTGCNSAGSSFTIDSENEITIQDGTMSQMACDGDAGAIESHMLGTFLGQVTYSIEDDQLFIENQNLGISAYTID
jgi:heat shock protein HslJ